MSNLGPLSRDPHQGRPCAITKDSASFAADGSRLLQGFKATTGLGNIEIEAIGYAARGDERLTPNEVRHSFGKLRGANDHHADNVRMARSLVKRRP